MHLLDVIDFLGEFGCCGRQSPWQLLTIPKMFSRDGSRLVTSCSSPPLTGRDKAEVK